MDGSTGLVSAAGDLAGHDGRIFKLGVSVVNQPPLDAKVGGQADQRGPKSYASLTVVIGQQSVIAGVDDDQDAIHIRHKRASVLFIDHTFLIEVFVFVHTNNN